MSRLFFYFKEAFKSIFRNKNTSFATIFSMAIALLILGITLSVVLNINNFTIIAKQEFSGVQVFLKNTINDESAMAFKKELEDSGNFSNINFISRQELMESFIANIDADFNTFSDIDNPCENSFRMYIKNPEGSSDIVTALQKDTRISSISYYEEEINNLVKTSKAVSIVSIIIIVILFILSLLVVENMIKIAIFARMREITIMKNIGATNWFVRWPFIIEGAILGFLGSLIAFFIVYFVYSQTYSNIPQTAFFYKYILTKETMRTLLLSLFVSTGVGIGILGSIVSLRKYLKV